MFAGDHLIEHISSNPAITRPLRDPGKSRPQALDSYLASLERTRSDELALVLPGHGEPVADHRSLIDARLAMHRKRRDKLMTLIADRPRSAYELAGELWGNVAVTQAFLTISEVVGHVDLLLNDGLVREVSRPDGVIQFEAV
jgi:glyoxylase-like metal-dependent hydrolase (beta-lactamase superfamily II)